MAFSFGERGTWAKVVFGHERLRHAHVLPYCTDFKAAVFLGISIINFYESSNGFEPYEPAPYISTTLSSAKRPLAPEGPFPNSNLFIVE